MENSFIPGVVGVVIVLLSVLVGYRWGYAAGMKSARLIIAQSFTASRQEEARNRYV